MDEHALGELAGKGLDLTLLKLDYSIGESKESVIASSLDVLPSMELGPALTYEDITLESRLSSKDFDAETLGD